MSDENEELLPSAAAPSPKNPSYSICMVSDFFYPNIGGVEEHIYNLAQILLLRGHKVIVITHCYGDYKGIRYLTNGLKVYYLPIQTFYNQATLPTVLCQVPLLRCVLLREEIQIVHGHSAFSTLSHEAMNVAKLLGMRTVFTDHSLFGFADLSATFTNNMLAIVLSSVDLCICVSHIGKENTVLRAKVPKENVYVIPNAVDTAHFTPDPDRRPTRASGKINIIVASRLVYRKGIDLLVEVLKKCKDQSEVNFIIAGEGPKRELIEEIREKFEMHERVEILGSVDHERIRDVLVHGHIFVNTSLTEAFCMAIVEAASCGLQVVTTNVGGIREVLPPGLRILVEPNGQAIYDGIQLAIKRYREQGQDDASSDDNEGENEQKPVLCPFRCNEIVEKCYKWEDIGERTEKVYKQALLKSQAGFGEILHSYMKSGVWTFLLTVSMCHLIIRFLDYIRPRHLIEKAKKLNIIQTDEKQKKL